MQLKIRSCQEERPKNLNYADRFYARVSERGDTAIGSYVSAHVKVEIQCKIGHRFMMAPTTYKSGSGCTKCSDNCPEQAKESFDALLNTNGDTLHGPYVNARVKVEIQCKIGHRFMIRPSKYKQGNGCRTCYLNKRYPNRAPTSLNTINNQLVNTAEFAIPPANVYT